MKYNWQMEGWPSFGYSLDKVQSKLLHIIDRAGQLQGTLQNMREKDQEATWVELMVAEAIKTSEIEGESLNRPEVASSIRNRLGINASPERVRDPASKGVGELMVAVRESWQADLTGDTLFTWHRLLMTGRADILSGDWRVHDEPMRVVSSGPMGDQKTLFEAPPSCSIISEMEKFIHWFNDSRTKILHGPVRAAVAHLYFESIHPFEDGNGRVGRAIAEKAISQGLGRPALINLSQAIEADRRRYYSELGTAQQTLEISDWVAYFVDVVITALDLAGEQIDFVLRKTRLLDRVSSQLNERQLKIVMRMLKEGPGGFLGGMHAGKYVAITGASKATATRDLQDLVSKGVLAATGGGRSSRYDLKL